MKYEDVKKPELIRWMKSWINTENEFEVLMIHYTADPDKDPERNWAEWYKLERKSVPLDTWNKEYEIDSSTKEGKLVFWKDFCDLDTNFHFINSREIKWEKMITLDFGQSNPNAWYVAVYDSMWRIFIVDEYFEPAIPSVASKDMFKKFSYHFINAKTSEPHTPESIMELSIDERRNLVYDTFSVRIIDPTTRHKNRVSKTEDWDIPYSIIEEFFDNWWDFEPWNNDIDAGITRIREYFKIDDNNDSRLFIFLDKCPNLCRELQVYHYKELTEKREREYNQPDVPVKKDEHWIDALRYLILTRPLLPVEKEKELTKIQKDIQSIIKPKVFNDGWDID